LTALQALDESRPPGICFIFAEIFTNPDQQGAAVLLPKALAQGPCWKALMDLLVPGKRLVPPAFLPQNDPCRLTGQVVSRFMEKYH
jgi:hypothetical protein